MALQKKMKLWVVNVVSFIVFVLLSVTGLINWLVLPRGVGRGSWLMEIRHLLIDVHTFLAVVFILVIGAHLWLHAAYVKANLNLSGWRNKKE